MNAPAVSVVTATYNRANVLRFSIESVLRGSWTDWELIVVGDACTDDTEALVASFRDPRIRFANLARNCGEQSGPNNAGVSLARGRLIAFLNHDDLWTRDHLADLVAEIDRTGADLVFSLQLAIMADDEPVLVGALREGRFEPHVFAPASTWLLRRELIERVGPWPSAREVHVAPSQEWLFRAWKSGADIRLLPRPSVIAVPSGKRKNSYSENLDADNARYAAALRDDEHRLIERLLARAAVNLHNQQQRFGLGRAVAHVGRGVLRAGSRLLGRHPGTLTALLRHGRRGGLVDSLRRVRGLGPLPTTQEKPS